MVYLKEVIDESMLYDGVTPIHIKIDDIQDMNAYERGIGITEELFNIQYPHLANTKQTIFP